jgi:hypothetical protein
MEERMLVLHREMEDLRHREFDAEMRLDILTTAV